MRFFKESFSLNYIKEVKYKENQKEWNDRVNHFKNNYENTDHKEESLIGQLITNTINKN